MNNTIKILDMGVESALNSSSESDAKIMFADKLLHEFRNMTGEDLEPYLESVIFDKKSKKVIVKLVF